MSALFHWLRTPNSEQTPKPTKPIRVLMEVRAFDKGGLEQVVLDTARHLDPDQFQVVIVSMKRSGYLAGLAAKAGITVHELTGIRRRQRYRSILKRERINLSVSHFSEYGYPLFRDLGIPNITFIQNVYAFLDAKGLHQIRTNDSSVDRYISVSPNATRYAVEKIGLPAAKFSTIPNGLSIDDHQARRQRLQPFARRELGIEPDDYVFLNVASYNLHKGHYLMAESMEKILRLRSDIRIVCIGNVVHPPHLRALKQHLRRRGLDRHLLLPGHFPNVESFHAMADAFLLPSFVEGWSVAMNEAMFYEKPLILTDTGAAAEVIQGSDIGLIIPNEYGDILELDGDRLRALAFHQRRFNTSDALVEAMLNFADHRELWRERGQQGRAKVIQNYAFTDIVRRYESIFLKTAASGSAISPGVATRTRALEKTLP